MRCLVTGGAGFIGSHLVDVLLSEGHDVVVIDNFSTGKEENLAQHKDNEQLTILKQSVGDDLTPAFTPAPDVVFHFAALTNVQDSIKDPQAFHKNNVNGLFNLLEACRVHGVKRFIFSSSSSVYGDAEQLPTTESESIKPMSPYALSKVVGEEYCKCYMRVFGLEPVFLRYFNVVGERQNPDGSYACLIPKFVKIITSGKQPTINGDGKQTRDFVYAGDVAKANLLAATTTNKEVFGEAFNIGTGENVSVNDVTAAILKATGSDIKPIHGPSVIEPRNTLADWSKAKKLLAWQPEVDFDEAMSRIVKEYQ